MVCGRSITAINVIFEKQNLSPVAVQLSEVVLSQDEISSQKLNAINSTSGESRF